MCRLVVQAVERGDETALANVRRIAGEGDYVPKDPSELCNRVLVTCYMGSENSSEETKTRAKETLHNFFHFFFQLQRKALIKILIFTPQDEFIFSSYTTIAIFFFKIIVRFVQKLAAQIGSYHLSISIDMAVKAVLGIFSTVTGFFPKFKVGFKLLTVADFFNLSPSIVF